MKVLVACEYSGIVREAFSEKGHEAWSCDLLPTDIPGNHIIGDAIEVAYSGEWDLMVAHPPCTYLTNSGVRWLYNKDGSLNTPRWEALDEASKFFRKLYDAPIPLKAIENPIQHKHALDRHGCGKADQYIQPWWFGHMEQKATGLWLVGLPKLHKTKDVKKEMMKLDPKDRQRVHFEAPSEDRWKIRSKTFQGVADAMAEQWSKV